MGFLDIFFGKKFADFLKEARENENTIILDVRTKEEFNNYHIKEAINHPVDKIQKYKGDKSKTHYIYCQSGVRSGQACQELTKAGYKTINMGGIKRDV